MFNIKAKKALALKARISARKAARVQAVKPVMGSYDWSINNTDVKAV